MFKKIILPTSPNSTSREVEVIKQELTYTNEKYRTWKTQFLEKQTIRGKSNKDKAFNIQEAKSKVKLSKIKENPTILAQSSRWRSLAKKAKVIGKLSLQNRDNLNKKYGINELSDQTLNYKKTFYILPDATYIKYWKLFVSLMDLYLLSLYVYRVCLLPLRVNHYLYIEIIMQGCFLFDTIINFFLAYYEQDDLVTDLKTIVIKYLFTFFFFDLMGGLPATLIIILSDDQLDDKSQRLVRLISTFRIIKFMIEIATYDGWKDIPFFAKMTPTIIRLIKILSLLLYFIHFSACIFVLLALINKSNNTWIELNDSQDLLPGELYVYALYWSTQTIVTVGFGDVTITNNIERIMAIVLMYVGSAVYSFMISNLGAILEEANTFEATLKTKINSFDKLAKETNLPQDLVKKVKQFIESNHKHNPRTSMQDQNFITELPFTLKAQIMIKINAQVIESVPFLKDKNVDFALKMAPNFKEIQLSQKEILFREDEFPESVFFLTSGSLYLKNKLGIPLYGVSKGEIFGEIEVMQNITRLTTAQAEKHCLLFSIEKEKFLGILSDYKDVKETLEVDVLNKKKRLIQLKKKHRGIVPLENQVVMGTQANLKAVNVESSVPWYDGNHTDKFENHILDYIQKGVGKKEKAKYVKRLAKRLSKENFDDTISRGSTQMILEPYENKEVRQNNQRGRFWTNILEENNQSYKSANKDVKFDDNDGDDDEYLKKDLESIEAKKKELEEKYFQKASRLQSDLEKTRTVLDRHVQDLQHQNFKHDKLTKLVREVEEKQKRIFDKLEMYKGSSSKTKISEDSKLS